MSEAQTKLAWDLKIGEAMAAEMREYVLSDVLFWPMSSGNMPRLTLGGYLMRQHRLLLLRGLLPEADQKRIGTMMDAYEAVASEWVVRIEQKAGEEFDARIRQWSEYLRDARNDRQRQVPAYYTTAVEARAMMEALLDQLRTAPFRLAPRLPEQLDLLDKRLRGMFHDGPFVWADGWQPAYPPERFWWLYGTP